MRRVGGGGSADGSNYIYGREDDNNVGNNIVIKTAERGYSSICSPGSKKNDSVSATNLKSRNIIGTSSIKTRLSQAVVSVNARWIHNPLFPRIVPLFQHLSSFTREVDISRNGMVEGCLLSNESTLLPLIGIIVKEWCDWIPALDFVPLTPLWIWVHD